MIKSVSAVSFGDRISTQSMLQRDGRYSKKPSQRVAPSTDMPEKELSTLNKSLIGLGIVALATASYLGYAVKNGKIEKIVKPNGMTEKMKNVAYSIGDTVKGFYESITRIFKSDSKVSK